MLSHTMHKAANPDGREDEKALLPAASPQTSFDADDYLPLLGESDLSEDQARELLATLWQVMCGFVELGLRVDVCGELGIDALPVLSSEPASLDSPDRTS